jgi:hypothetical protein
MHFCGRNSNDRHDVFCTVNAHINDDLPALVFRGQDYIGSVHVERADDGTWGPVSGHLVHWSKRPQWTDAPPTHAQALTHACAQAVQLYTDAYPDMLERGWAAGREQDAHRVETDIAQLEGELADKRAKLKRVLNDAGSAYGDD